MVIPRKAYKVSFGEMCTDKREEFEVTHATSKTVMAETALRAVEIAIGLLKKREQKLMYATQVELLVEGFDAD